MVTMHNNLQTSKQERLARLVRAGLLTGITDGLFSSVLSVAFYHSTVARLFQGVAAVPLGSDAFNGGTRMAVIGVLLHFGVAFTWSAVFLFIVMRWSRVRAVLASSYGMVKVAALYGPFIWLVMSFIVMPAFTQRATPITIRWWVQLIGHFPFVGLPIVAASCRNASRAQG